MTKQPAECFSDAFDEVVERIFLYADDFEEPVLIRGRNKIYGGDLTDTLNAYGPRDVVVNFNGDIEAWEKSIKEQIREDDANDYYVWVPEGMTALDVLRPVLDTMRPEIEGALRTSWLTEASEAWDEFVHQFTCVLGTDLWKKWPIDTTGMVRASFSEWDISVYLYGVFESLNDHDCKIWHNKG